MIPWIAKIHWGKAALVGFIFTVFSMIVRQVEALYTMKYYLMPEYFGVWSKIMMPSAGPPPITFMVISLLFTFVTGLSLTVVYYYVKEMLPKVEVRRILFFADLMIAMNFIFFLLPVYLLFNVPLGLLLSWFISSFLILLSASYTIVKVIR